MRGGFIVSLDVLAILLSQDAQGGGAKDSFGRALSHIIQGFLFLGDEVSCTI